MVFEHVKSGPTDSLSDFAAQVLKDHPGLSVAEAKVVADTLLRCADFVAQQRNTGSSASSHPT